MPICVATLCGCVGFRTPLDDCPTEGQTQPYSDTCGKGTRICSDGRWSMCQVAPVVADCTSVCGPGTQTCADNKQGACTAPQPKQPRFTALIRDFRNSFPDMDHSGVAETGIVASAV